MLIVFVANILSWIFCKVESIARQRHSVADYVAKLLVRFIMTNYLMGRFLQVQGGNPWFTFILVLAFCEGLFGLGMTLALLKYRRVLM